MARNPDRIDEVLGLIEHLWRQDPDLRLLQLILNAAHYEDSQVGPNPLFFVEDDTLVRGLRQYAKQFDG